MKGIVHFISGIAAATFIPGAVQQAGDGSLLLVLGGVFGLLPDTIDFRFARYLEHHDRVIDPDPHAMQPQALAEAVAATMQAAFETGRPQALVLHTVRLSASTWRAYSLRFDPPAGEVVVRVGPVVDTSGAALPGSAPEDAVGRARVGAPIVHTYDDEIPIDVFSGPSFRFERRGDRVHVTFLPWHRRWSHSLVLAAAIGLGLSLLLGTPAGLAAGLGYATHVLQDQLGQMGSNLLWPLTRRRTRGLGLLRSADPLPNFLTAWGAAALILFNLDRFAAAPRLPAAPYLVGGLLVPLLCGIAWFIRGRRRGMETPLEALRQEEILTEANEGEPQ